jgi:hypothetical protein
MIPAARSAEHRRTSSGTHKTCNCCRLDKPVTRFPHSKHTRDGRTDRCLDCITAAAREDRERRERRCAELRQGGVNGTE